ncbi:hypothetical protein [Halorientalis sp.]|jgi:hypothetical protein|uniref:hypothetical protein n=1 Tax=Halorientalis sp. TaxID=1931229 RepID=UPI00261B85E3|nr:hypothetical protein [Halorientalis sp.]
MTDQDTQTADRAFTDPEFAALALTVDDDDALEKVHATVKGLHATPTPVGTKIRTTNGALVAVVHALQAESDDVESVLHYRTDPAAALATRKARTLRRALDSHEADVDPDVIAPE